MKSFVYAEYFKRPLDILASSAGLLVFSPLLMMAALLVKINMGSQVLFKQKRPGLNGKIFTICKFRTMTGKKDKTGNLLPDRERLTSAGSFLRSLSIDELPGLYNVFKGDMSIVGPRPLLVEYLPRYNREQMKRHSAKPGLTGLAQVSGRNAVSWDERFALDVFYAENVSFVLDCRIIMMTPVIMLKKQGVNKSGNITMDKFRGGDE